MDFSIWSSSRERWCYCAVPRSIYKFVEEQQKLHTRKRERSPDLERCYASGQCDRDPEMQEQAEKQARVGNKFCIEDVDPEVMALL